MNNPIDFFKSLFKSKKTTLTGNEVIALQYLHPEKGAINTGDYCTTQDIANLSPPYTLPLTINVDTINEATSGYGVTIEGVRILDGLIPSGAIPPIEYRNISASGETADTAAPLSYGFNYINNASVAQRGVYLPTDIQEQNVYIINSTATPIYVYGENAASSILKLDTRDFVADTTYLVLNKNASVKFFRVGTRWVAEPFNGIKNKPLIYKAILTQSGTNAPVATVLNSNDSNYLGDLTWLRDDVGSYYASKNGISSTNTLLTISGIRTAATETIYSGNAQTNTILINQFVAGSRIDGILYLAVTIEYYGA